MVAEEITFASWLRQRRKELSITQEVLAERLDISWITLRKLESGERRPSGQIALLLAEVLRVPPDERHAFVAFARTGRQAQGDVSPNSPWRSTFIQQTNLPAFLSSLIGREEEVSAGLDHLLNPRTRLLTLTGAPGIGKTRLGLQIALDLLGSFEDGVYFVDLSSITDPDLVLPTIAHTLGLKETPGQSSEGVLIDYLRQKRALLMLDNFEQVLDASIEVVKMMNASPWLKVLVTSREALQVRGERRLIVPPLPTPDKARHHVEETQASYSSVELFVERAQAIVPSFELTAENAEEIAAICARLDGLPLAIELAAGQARHLSLTEMKLALGRPLTLLTGGGRDLPARQRTLRSAIEWSYSLLSNEEQILFARLSVFVGGLTLSAVEALWDSQGVDKQRIDDTVAVATPQEILRSLEEKSLIKLERLGGRDESRFGMLGAIREYAREKLRTRTPPGDVGEVEKSHAVYFMGLAEEAALHLKGARQQEWLDRLEEEHDNLLAVLTWAEENSDREMHGTRSSPDAWRRRTAEIEEHTNSNKYFVEGAGGIGAPEIYLRTAAALGHFWFIRGYLSEGREHLEAALSYPTSPAVSPGLARSERAIDLQAVRARVLEGAGILAHELGDDASGLALQEESLTIRREIGDREGIASSLNTLGVTAQDRGDYATGLAFHEESLAVWRDLGVRQGEALALTNLGRALFGQEKYDEARSFYEQGLVVWREASNKRGIALSLTYLGFVLYVQEKYGAALALFEEGLSIQREIGNKWGVATLLSQLGTISFMLGNYAAARTFHEDSLAIFRGMGHKKAFARTLHSLALVLLAQGEHSSARTMLQESLSSARDMDDRSDVADNLAGLGGVAAEMRSGGEALRAARLLGASDALIAVLGVAWLPEDLTIYVRGIETARDRLDEESFEIAFAEGRAMSQEQAVAYALDQDDLLLAPTC